MRPIVLAAGLAVAAAGPTAEAACPERVTCTVAGAVAGGLLGNVVAGRGTRTEGTLLGAAAGGFAGNRLSDCPPPRRAYYRAPPARRAASDARGDAARARTCRYETAAYYDPHGQLIYAPRRMCAG